MQFVTDADQNTVVFARFSLNSPFKKGHNYELLIEFISINLKVVLISGGALNRWNSL